MSADQELMQAIKTQWGELLKSVTATSSVPEAFLAALIANETGGKADAQRFEPAVFSALAEVLLGRKAAYGSIGAQDLRNWLVPHQVPSGGDSLAGITAAFRAIADLATSWGLTQIMGYEAIALHTNGVQALQSPASELVLTTKMLADFASRFGLDPAKDFGELFSCWNTGRPHAQTADPQYVPNGLARMQIYAGLA
jgi:hypothetical protein